MSLVKTSLHPCLFGLSKLHILNSFKFSFILLITFHCLYDYKVCVTYKQNLPLSGTTNVADSFVTLQPLLSVVAGSNTAFSKSISCKINTNS